MKPLIIKKAITNVTGTLLYVIAISMFLFNAPKFFGQEDSPLIPIIMLLLLIFSAALTGSLVFGQPVLWYMDGKKKEAVELLVATMGFLLVVILVAIILLASRVII